MNGRFKLLIAFITVGLVMFAQKYYAYDSSKQSISSYVVEEYQSTETTPKDYKSSAETNICQKCGNRFIGRGYTEVAHGVWRETQAPYQSFICSQSCGSAHTRNWESILGKKSDGKVYDKEPCGLCEGTGIERNHGSMANGYGRTCPMCDGKGYQSY